MSGNNDVTGALRVLDEKLETLGTMTEVNSFLITALREHEQDLMRMDPQETRAMLRRKARDLFRPDGGRAPNAAALALLEETLGNGQSAEIIAFPGPRRGAAD
ncbi:hypothetical protein [Phaeobacter sp. HF9A]|uniref:hypothetical protein n=1 Tax=Phaeobacter sp. HF9A TaxID=2721561 RepID=UPI00143194FC|nr:hypothetical protein [Phaeobacter sp. HF9A]NIZ14951.1 hypothetical protein [Phaeobacter sp. HF9A]